MVRQLVLLPFGSDYIDCPASDLISLVSSPIPIPAPDIRGWTYPTFVSAFAFSVSIMDWYLVQGFSSWHLCLAQCCQDSSMWKTMTISFIIWGISESHLRYSGSVPESFNRCVPWQCSGTIYGTKDLNVVSCIQGIPFLLYYLSLQPIALLHCFIV